MLEASDLKADSISVLDRATDWTAQAAQTGLTFRGFQVQENNSAAASFRIYNGVDSSEAGELLASVVLASGERAYEFTPDSGIDATKGIRVDRISGQADIVIFFKIL